MPDAESTDLIAIDLVGKELPTPWDFWPASAIH